MIVTLNLNDYEQLVDKCYYNHIIYKSKRLNYIEIMLKYHADDDQVDIKYRNTYHHPKDWEWIGSTTDYYIESGELMFTLYDLWT